MSACSTSSSFSLLVLTTIVVILCFHSRRVRSEVDPLRLPSDDHISGGLCVGTVSPSSCPVRCFRTDPVCGVDGVTYWCGCADALCAGTRVAKLGFCEVGNGGSGPISGQAFLLVHIVWLILLGFFVLFGVL